MNPCEANPTRSVDSHGFRQQHCPQRMSKHAIQLQELQRLPAPHMTAPYGYDKPARPEGAQLTGPDVVVIFCCAIFVFSLEGFFS